MPDACILANNVSTAFGKRRKWWTETKGAVPPDSVVDSSCENDLCFAPEHAFMRPKIAPNVWGKLFGHIRQRLVDLPCGANFGMVLASGQDPEKIAIKLRSFLIAQAETKWFRWAVRVRNDRILVINKIGQWGTPMGGREEFELFVEPPLSKPRSCLCGCGETATNGAFVEGHLKRALKMQLCPSCGAAFEGEGVCCSRDCSSRYRLIRKELGYVGKERRHTSYAY